MATQWLTSALNAIPNTFAIHGLSPESESFKTSISLAEMLTRMAAERPEHRCGLVHIANASRILMAGIQGEFRQVRLEAAQLFRNPVMLAEAMACAVVREWEMGGKYKAWAADMREQVLGDRWGRKSVVWPARVKAAILENDDMQVRRLLGIWSRTKTEAIEALNFEFVVQQIKVNPHFGIDRYPAFRFEDYTSDVTAFCNLLEHLLGHPAERGIAAGAFRSPAMNKHRDGNINDPEQVYFEWSVAEREMFTTIFLVTGYRGFCEASLRYRFPYIDSRIPDWHFELSEPAPLPGISLNYQML